MTDPEYGLARDAEGLMRAHRYREAIARFEVRLAEDPQDLCSLLRMGLCHLLDRSEAVFVAIYHRATAIIGELGEVPARARKLWFQYQQLVQSVTATALVVGGREQPPEEHRAGKTFNKGIDAEA